LVDVVSIFREVRDPRQPNARHDLGELLFVSLAAMLCGAKTCVEMAEFAGDRLDELRQIVDLRHGAPSHDTFSRVFRLLDPRELGKAFEACLAAVRESLRLPAPSGVVALDGKSLRRAYEKGGAHMPALMVGVFETQTRLAIAQSRAIGGAEIAAGLELLKGLSLKGCTVTADALHCTRATATAIREAKAHYALTLKQNPPRSVERSRVGLRDRRRQGGELRDTAERAWSPRSAPGQRAQRRAHEAHLRLPPPGGSRSYRGGALRR
jgi:hypothetical protein